MDLYFIQVAIPIYTSQDHGTSIMRLAAVFSKPEHYVLDLPAGARQAPARGRLAARTVWVRSVTRTGYKIMRCIDFSDFWPASIAQKRIW